MAERPKGMGRGLAAILNVAPRDEPEELRELPLAAISPNPAQPRQQFDQAQLVALADSIRARGVVQPILVRPEGTSQYQLIAGERRWRAAQLAELNVIPAIVRYHDDAASLELALIENMVREDLNPVDEARACAALVEEIGLTREQVGLRIGRSRVTVSNLLRLLELPDEVLELLEQRRLSEGHGRALLLAADNSERRTLARQAAAEQWSVRELERRARQHAAASKRRIPRQPREADEHPDREAAAEQLAEALSEALGADVRVRCVASGYTAQLSFATADDALELARRVQMRSVV